MEASREPNGVPSRRGMIRDEWLLRAGIPEVSFDGVAA